MRLRLAGLAALVLALSACALPSVGPQPVRITPDQMKPVRVASGDAKFWKDISTDDVEHVKRIVSGDHESSIANVTVPFEGSIYARSILEYKSDREMYGKSDFWATFKLIHKLRRDDCDGGAISVAALLSDNGFPPYIAVVNGPKHGHAIFVYKNQKGLFGACGRNRCDNFPPSYRSFDGVLDAISSHKGEYNTYRIYDFTNCLDDLIAGDRNIDPEI